MRSVVSIALALVVFQVIIGELGPTSPELGKLLGVIVVALLLFIEFPSCGLKSLRFFGILLSALGMFFAPTWFFQGFFLGSAMMATSGRAGQRVGALVVFVGLIKLLSAQISFLASGESFLSTWIHYFSYGTSFEPSSVGPSGVGFHSILVCFLVAGLARRSLGRYWLCWHATFALGILFVPHFTATLVADGFGVHRGHGHAVELFDNLKPLAFVLCGVNALCLWRIQSDPHRNKARPVRQRSIAYYSRIALGLAWGVALVFPVSGWTPRSESIRKVTIIDEGGIDWDIASVRTPGVFNNGMFGLLPEYLLAAGWEVEISTRAELDRVVKEDGGIIMTINSPHLWDSSEKSLMEEYVKRGGGLLVLGDHTNVFNLQVGLNTLLCELGIKFRFDSAYHIEPRWERSVTWIDGFGSPSDMPEKYGIAIGASLEVDWPAFPIVVGSYSFSDHGVGENVVGAFLGNYSFDDGEEYGDLPLVAGRYLGRGSVVVFGDTSSFQNGGLPETFVPFVLPLLDSMSRAGSISLEGIFLSKLAILVAAAVLFLFIGFGVPIYQEGFLSGVSVVLLFCLAQKVPSDEDRFSNIDLKNGMVIPRATMPNIGHFTAKWNDISSLTSAANRSGLLTYFMDDWEVSILSRANAVAFIAPTCITKEMVDDIPVIWGSGVNFLVVASSEEASAANKITQPFGIQIANKSLGTLPKAKLQDPLRPRFVDPSPLLLTDDRSVPLFTYGEACISAVHEGSKSTLIVIGDSRFFSSRNFEGTWGYWTGNLRHIHGVFTDFFGLDPAGFLTSVTR